MIGELLTVAAVAFVAAAHGRRRGAGVARQADELAQARVRRLENRCRDLEFVAGALYERIDDLETVIHALPPTPSSVGAGAREARRRVAVRAIGHEEAQG